MSKVNLKDTHYIAQWDKNDLPKVRKWQERIRAGLDKSVEFTDLLEKNLNDHHNLMIDPLNVAVDRKYILTWNGITKMCRLVTRQDSTTFTHVAVGTGATTATVPQPYDTQLVTEAFKIDFATNGFFDAAGISIRYCGTFGSELPDADLTESLVRNQAASTGSIVLCHNVFASNFIDHNSGASGFSAAGVIEFVPVVD